MRRLAATIAIALLPMLSAVPARAQAPPLTWLTSSYGPVKMYQSGATTNWASTYAIMNQGACNKLPPGAQPAYWFADYDTFAAAVADGEIAGQTPGPNGCEFAYKAVVVDYENWANTPPDESQNWATYVAQAYELAHSLGLFVIQAMTPGPAGGWGPYLADDVPGYEAQYADAVDIQAQQQETDLSGQPGSFNYEVNTAAAEIAAASPATLTLAGMRGSGPTCPADDVTPDQITAAWATVSANVNGSWFNANCNAPAFDGLVNELYS